MGEVSTIGLDWPCAQREGRAAPRCGGGRAGRSRGVGPSEELERNRLSIGCSYLWRQPWRDSPGGSIGGAAARQLEADPASVASI